MPVHEQRKMTELVVQKPRKRKIIRLVTRVSGKLCVGGPVGMSPCVKIFVSHVNVL